MNTLTSDQIQSIFDFTEQKYIKYYDVQLELVDHIANRIEEMQAEDPNLSFEQAMQTVYKSFGIYGFTKVQERKMFERQSYWKRQIWSYVKSYFKLPKIIIMMILSFLIYLFMKQGYLYPLMSDMDYSLWVLITSIIAMMVLIPLLIFVKRRLISTQKKLLCVDAYMGVIAYFLLFPLHIFIDPFFFCPPTLPWFILLAVSVFISFVIILMHAMIFVFPERLKSEVKHHYKHLIID
jgi:hypothetical protein